MTGLGAALRVEALKLRRSNLVWVAGAAVAVGVPVVATAFVGLAAGDGGGPAGAKARAMVIGTGWDAVLSTAAQLEAGIGLLAFGVVASWCVGREFTDRTIVGLFAQTVSRRAIATAKILLVVAWAAIITVVMTLLVAVGGLAIGLPASGLGGIGRLGVLGLLTAAVAVPAGWIATILRGYLGGIAATLVAVIGTQFAVALGGGAWVPWAAPAMWAGAAGHQVASSVSLVQLALPILVGLIGAWGTARAWHRLQLGR